MIRFLSLSALLVLVVAWQLSAQPFYFGQYPVQYFSAEFYGANPQNWAVAQDPVRGFMYFGNYRGLLENDGQHWRLHPLPNGTAVRSLHIDAAQARIYVGGQGEFGYFKPDVQGMLQYVSLSDSLDANERSFADVWSILPPTHLDSNLHFVTAQRIFEFRSDKLQGASQPETGAEFEFGFVCRGRKFVCKLRVGLCEIKSGKTPLVEGGAAFAMQNVSLMLPLGRGDFLIGTKDPARLYRYDGANIQPWPENGAAWPLDNCALYRGVALGDSLIVLGTRQYGAFVLNTAGQGVAQINRGPDLPNDNVLALCVDQVGNLWLGLENGIAMVELNSPVRNVTPQNSSPKTWGVGSALHQDQLCLITGNGLFSIPVASLQQPFGSKQFAELKSGEALSLCIVDDQLFLGHHNGTFLVQSPAVRPLVQELGGWIYRALPGRPDCWIGGHYHGLVLYKRLPNGGWTAQKLEKFDNPCRLLEVEKTAQGIVVWVSHVYKGVYRVLLNDNLTGIAFDRLLNVKQGLPSNFGTNVFKVDSQIVFTTRKGIYRYVAERQVFEKHPGLLPYFGENHVSRIAEDSAGNLWCVVNGQLWRYIKDGPMHYRRDFNPWLSKLDHCFQENFEHIYPLNDRQILVGAQPAFLLFQTDYRPAQAATFKAVVREVKALDPAELIFAGHFTDVNGGFSAEQAADVRDKLRAGKRNLRFIFAAPYFDRQTKIQFRHWLKGSGRDTSEWSGQTVQEYSNLSTGRYEFTVWARNAAGEISQPAIYRFEILRSPEEYAMWVAGSLIFAFLVFSLWKRRRDSQTIAQQDQTIQESVQDRTVLLDQVFKTPTVLRKALMALASVREKPIAPLELESVHHLLHEHLTQLEERESQMIFLKSPWILQLRQSHPELTNTDLQYIYYIDAGFSSREIADNMGVTEGAVKNRETTIRQRLGAPKGADLQKFLAILKS